jgi:hypothetical protein
MIKLPVRCEQDTANSIVIRDATSREITHLISSSDILSTTWEDAKQIVRALNATIPKKEKKKCS